MKTASSVAENLKNLVQTNLGKMSWPILCWWLTGSTCPKNSYMRPCWAGLGCALPVGRIFWNPTLTLPLTKIFRSSHRAQWPISRKESV